VRLGVGSQLAADAVLVAVGATPNTRLGRRRAAGRQRRGRRAALRSSDSDIFAAGGVANAFHLLGRHVRVEH
jgi:3-phenylpropionate/trans-cinnamate dioxygenase ferredoxin reductase component